MATFKILEEKENENLYNSMNPTKNSLKNQASKRATFTVLNNIVGQNQQTGHQGKKGFRDVKSNNLQENDENYMQIKVQKDKKDDYYTQQNKNVLNKNSNNIIATSLSACENATKTNVPADQLKSFSVFEDEKTVKHNKKPFGDSLKPFAVPIQNTKAIYDKTIKVTTGEIKPKQDDAKNNKILVDAVYDKTIKQLLKSSGNVSMSSSAIRDPLRDITKNDSLLGGTDNMSFRSSSLSPMNVDVDVDDITKKPPRNDRERFFEVEEYQNCILEYFREIELKNRPRPNYMSRQQDINHSMRTILVDWLVEVSEEYRLHSETLFLAVSYVDRFLSYMSVVRGKLQLVGTSTMFIAAKYEEIYPPDVGEFVFITDDTYTKEQVLRMEQIVLKILSFDLSAPTSYVFINTYAVLYSLPEEVKFLAIYLCELSLLDGATYLKYLPSQMSSASIALARYCLDMPMWDKELERITTYKLNQLNEIMISLCKTHITAKDITQQAIQEKYKHTKYMEVSKIKAIDIESEHLDKVINEQSELIDEMENENNENLNTLANSSLKYKNARKYGGMM